MRENKYNNNNEINKHHKCKMSTVSCPSLAGLPDLQRTRSWPGNGCGVTTKDNND